MVARLTFPIALLSSGLAAAQQLPAPLPPAPAQPPAKTAVQPTPHPPVRREATPVIRPKPSTPPKRPPVHPVAPAPAPIPDPVPEKPAEPTKGSVTGQPLPRYAALRADEVYMRLGPGKRYPIEWVYKRRDLPMRIEREFEEWRLVRDQENTKGWVHQATLAPRRTAVVIGGEQIMRHDARDDAAPVARLKPGVIVRLRSCDAASDWCQTQIQDYRGWMKRSEVWGMLPGEGIQ
jgi:SH3-like domain-containing protein